MRPSWEQLERSYYPVLDPLTCNTLIQCNSLGDYEKRPIKVKMAVATFWATLEKIRLLFISASGHTECK